MSGWIMEQTVSVLKFGGTSVGSGERIRNVAKVAASALKEDESFPVVVVSAMSGVTDQLLRIARYACDGEDEACAHELVALRKKHLEAAEHVLQGSKLAQLPALIEVLEECLVQLGRDVEV